MVECNLDILSKEEANSQQPGRKSVYTYETPWLTYALGCSWKNTQKLKIAVGSFKDDLVNEVF